jgi:cysteine dioxygenase
MKKFEILEVVQGLREIPDEEFLVDPVYDFLGTHPINADSIARFLHWSDSYYTRNLIYKDERFEMMAICWEKGQYSAVHNHWDQKCWMTVPIGKLRGQNFKVESYDAGRAHCRLSETNSFDLTDCVAAKVELEEPIHQVLNLPEFDERAVSIHVYSKPYDRCLSYCRETDTFKEVQLAYTSIDGKLCDGVRL